MVDSIKQVLIVEDEVFVAMSLSMELRAAGYTVAETCASGEDALAFLEHANVDVVLMDIGLAGALNGLEAAVRIRSHSAVSIVFMTGYANMESDPAVATVDPLGFLVKPVSFRNLLTLLEEA